MEAIHIHDVAFVVAAIALVLAPHAIATYFATPK